MSVQNEATSINAQMAASLAEEAGQPVSEVTERVEAAEGDKASKLQQMLAQAAEAQTQKKVAAKPSTTKAKGPAAPASASSTDEDGNSRQRRNYDVPTRQIHVFKSPGMNALFISSNLLYDNKESAKQVELCRRDLKPQKKPTELMAQEDLFCETVAVDVPFGDELNQMKADLHDQLKLEGWTMISNRPRINVSKPVEPPKAEAPEVVDTPAAEEVAPEDLQGVPEAEAASEEVVA